MGYEINLSTFLIVVLLKHEYCNIPIIKDFYKKLQSKIDCYIDISSRSIYGIMEFTDIFEWKNIDDCEIVFSKNLDKNKESMLEALIYILPEEIYDVFVQLIKN